jgi:hypothetical protein
MRYSLSIKCNAVRPKYRRAVKLSAALIACAAIVAIAGLDARAAGAPQVPIAASSPDGVADPKGLLAARGLLESSDSPEAAPPDGVEVDEYLQTDAGNGGEMMKIAQWEELIGDHPLEVERVTFPGGQSLVQSFVLQPHGRGCMVFAQRGFNHAGVKLLGNYWRNDSDIHIAGANDFPPELFPNNGIPTAAFLDALSAPAVGATGQVNQQITPYGYTRLNVWGERIEQIHVPAGDFRALKVVMRIDIRSFLPTWPNFLIKIVEPFITENVFYFQADPPHRFLKAEGITSFGGPKSVTELTRYYVAGHTASAAPSPPAEHAQR